MNSKHRSGSILGLATAAVGILGLANQAQAVTVETPVTGSFGKTMNGCLQLLTFSVGGAENCMYDSGPAVASESFSPTSVTGEITGPYSQMQYYSTVTKPETYATTYLASNGDGKINPLLSGSVTIDDGGNGFGAGDLISFSLTMTDPLGGKVIRNTGGSTNTTLTANYAERWTSMTQVLAPLAASSATANGSGGFDYVIGSEGFPALLTFGTVPGDFNAPTSTACNGQTFGNMECGASFGTADTLGNPITDPDRWTPNNTSGGPGLGSLEANIGADTVGTLVGFECVDNIGTLTTAHGCRRASTSFAPLLGTNGVNTTGAGASATERGAAEDVGWDQLLLKVSTDAAGNVTSIAGFDVQEYRVFPTTPGRCGDNTTGTGSYSSACNSWVSGYFTATAVPVPAAAWLLAPAVLAAGRFARRRKTG